MRLSTAACPAPASPSPSAPPPDPAALLRHLTSATTPSAPTSARSCEAIARGRDVLFVMPTGAGKPLRYQLPGLARGGITIVVSPLIALMDDQVQKLKAQGLRARAPPLRAWA